MYKNINYKLWLGITLLAFFIFISFFGSYLAPYPKDYQVKVSYGESLIVPPLPPSKEHPFGTDKWGYDLLSLLLHGAKYTVFTVMIVAAIRIIIGSIFGIIRGLNGRPFAPKKKKVTIFNSIPPVVIIYFIMIGVAINPNLLPISLAVIQAFLMIILGISGVHDVIYAKTSEVKQSLYVMASETLGGTKWHIMKKHILPILKGNLSILFMNETIQVLHLIGQLGIFHIFFGGTIFQPDFKIYLSITHEWAGLIGQARSFFSHSQWIVAFPLLAYVLLLLSFYLLSAGVTEQGRKKMRKNMYL
ncbi:peptide ABC transporter permease [Niallia sp. NCCP-28]|uniref:peptide ABC transporter permease n=1 Tax=Niallia sp. NCCP-28 TaxID=2934712 RepID=UPI0020828206|nr:peptide ABC transporter permease [Niallia sp. NCCP-28]GKU83440.1 peptide ABC transporter permease [Niallia sp. NCCP-28]